MGDFLGAGRAYTRLSRRRAVVWSVALLGLLLSLLFFGKLHLAEDVAVLLPDGEADAAAQFRLLERSPLTRKLLVHLEAKEGTSTAELVAAADRMASHMAPPLFGRVVTGPGEASPFTLSRHLMDRLPSLLDEADYEELARRIEPGEIERRMGLQYAALLTPAGWGTKAMLRDDPLGFVELGLQKLRHVNLVGEMTLVSGHFASRDGRHLLLLAETPVALTDSGGARKLAARFDELAAEADDHGVKARFLSAHRYTLANADAIRRDLKLVLSLSSLLVLGLLAFFLRTPRSLLLFLVPAAALFPAALLTSTLLGGLSTIALGFGGVLLGVAVDYGIHVHYACRRSAEPPAAALGRAARPMAFAFLTTLAAFATLSLSELPGQRQLALFALTGLALAFAGALYLLPQGLGKNEGGLPEPRPLFSPRGRRWVLVPWGALFLSALFFAPGVRFDGDLNRLSLHPPEIAADEAAHAAVWGKPGGRALFFVEGPSLDAALAENEKLFESLKARFPEISALSVAPLLPPEGVQEARRAAWRAFWSEERRATLVRDLEAAARRYRFAADAFAPFVARLGGEGLPADAEALRTSGLGDLLDALVTEKEGRVGIVTLLDDRPEVAAFGNDFAVQGSGRGFVSPSGFTRLVGGAIRADFLRFLVAAALAVTLLASLLFRSPKKTAAALLPVASGLAALFSVMGLFNLPFDLFNIVATALVIGLGVDYGIFMVFRVLGEGDGGADHAVLLSGLTTLSGIGTLALASHPALFSIGVTILVGIGAAIPTALWVVPAFLGGEEER